MSKIEYTGKGNHIDEYIFYQVEYEKKYGKKCVVLMETGSFMEIYGVDNDTEIIGDVSKVAELLNIQLTRRDKKNVENSRRNPQMAGFPTHSMHRFINILLLNQYTVVCINQHNVGGRKFKRKVGRVLSPGTYVDESFTSNANNIIYVYIDSVYDSFKNCKYIVGVSVIDLSTGESHVYEIYSDKSDLTNQKVFEDVYSFIESYNPTEMIIRTNNMNMEKSELLKYFNTTGRVVHLKYNEKEIKFDKLQYQNELLSKIFKNCGSMTPIEYINLEMKLSALISYVSLLQFAYEHDENIIKKIDKPKFWKDKTHLVLTNNTLYQLNIVRENNYMLSDSSTKYRCLFDVINLTKTCMGKRLLNYRLLNPIIDSIKLRERWDMIEILINISKKSCIINDIEHQLINITDLERYHRKLTINIIQPYEFANLSCSYDSIIEILKYLNFNDDLDIIDNKSKKSKKSNESEKNDLKRLCDKWDTIELFDFFTTYIKEYYTIFDIELMSKYSINEIEESIISEGYNIEIDTLQKNINDIHEIFNKESKYLTGLSKGNIVVKLEKNDRDGYFYVVGNSKVAKLKKLIELNKKNDVYTFKKKTVAYSKIESNNICKYSSKLIKLKKEMCVVMRKVYIDILEKLDKKYSLKLKKIIKFISELDVSISNSKVSQKFGYCKPEIIDSSNTEDYDSKIDAQNIRHPIIERLDMGISYVPNNVVCGDTYSDGTMLYGINGCGKSSYLKSIGLNIVLAQMGMYVSAETFKFIPFTHIFTRILGNDNLFKGMSSFNVEMSELRTIFYHSDKRSLVLGDEICKGTETVSAVSIVGATIENLLKRGVKFFFTTHYHQLTNINIFKKSIADKSLACFYFSVREIPEKNSIIYDRKLKVGSGEPIYGIKVAKHIINDNEFIKSAENIRKEIMNIKTTLLGDDNGNINKSSYNSKLIIEFCQICNKDLSKVGKGGLDVHHIKFQSECCYDTGLFSDSEKYNKYIHKNDLSNLIVLCKEHHIDVHNGKVNIKGYLNTSDGRILDWNFVDNFKKSDTVLKKKKLNIIHVQYIKRIRDTGISKPIILKKLKNEYNIKISMTTLNKVINNIY